VRVKKWEGGAARSVPRGTTWPSWVHLTFCPARAPGNRGLLDKWYGPSRGQVDPPSRCVPRQVPRPGCQQHGLEGQESAMSLARSLLPAW
jgi:hypothetical protein